MRVQTIAQLILACGLVFCGTPMTNAQVAGAQGGPVKLQSLRGGTPVNLDNPPVASHQERDHAVGDRDFVQQPPLIPHNTQGYQITRNFNKCMDCHAWQKTMASGATKVSVTHFRTREGQELDNISPRRYFCTQCHVPQTDAKALVDNTFTRARGLR